MRDTLRKKDHFDDSIAFMEKTIARDIGAVDTIARQEGRASQLHSLCQRSAMVLAMRYSRGDPIADARSSAIEMVRVVALRAAVMPTLDLPSSVREMWGNLTLTELYDDLVCMAFVVSLRFSGDEVLRTLHSMSLASKDGLMERIEMRVGVPRTVSLSESHFSNVYNDLIDVIDAEHVERAQLLKAYVESWYNKMKIASWHGNHKGEAYVGYWCFEGALVAILWDVDDATFAQHKHYPADLVKHYRTTA